MPPGAAVPALLLGHSASRAAAVWLIRCLPYAGDIAHAKAKPLAQRVSAAGAGVSLAWIAVVGAMLVVSAPGCTPIVAVALVAAVATTLCMRNWLKRRLGGYTGDALGATQQVTELGVLLSWLAVSRWVS